MPIIILGILILASLGGLAWTWGLNFLHILNGMRESTPFFFFAIIALILLAAAYKMKSVFAGVLVAVTVIVGTCFVVTTEHNRLKTYYNESVVVVEEEITPDYSERAPFEVATLTSDKLLNTTGEAQETKSLSDLNDYGMWNTLIRTKGPFNGYESVQTMNLPLYGTAQSSDVEYCKFEDNNTLRHSGSMPHNNLSRAIYGMVPLNVDFDEKDSYGYCNNKNQPIVAVPLKSLDGFFYPIWKFYGVATYNGTTGELKVHTSAEAVDEIPGPVYPASLAATQRTSIYANMDWWQQTINASGYDPTSGNTEVQLRQLAKTDSDYVTTLIPRGSSTSIVAVSYVDATEAVPGKFNKLTLNMLSDEYIRPANSTLVDDITSRYSYMPDISNGTLGVFEITAHKDGGWVASIGLEQSVNYRAYITHDLKISLYNRDGKLISQGVGEIDPDTGETDVNITDSTNLDELSNEELVEINKKIIDELAERANSKPTDSEDW